MTETIPCLLRLGENVKKYRLFKLDRDQVTIGRSGDVTYAILSNMISRNHAVIDRKENGQWDITDRQSLNGIFVNGRQLIPSQPYRMQDGDMVQFGVATSPDAPAEFIYKFYTSLKVRVEKKNKRMKTEHPMEKSDTLSSSEPMESESGVELKRKNPIDKGDRGDSPSKALQQQIEKSQKEQAEREAEYRSRLAHMEKLLKEKEERQVEVQRQLERERQEKEDQAKEVEELRQKEQAILQEMQDKQETLEKERERLKQQMQEELEANLKDREQALKAQLSAQHEALMQEKKQVEGILQKEMETALEGKNKELEEQLREQKLKLEKVIEKKELEQKMLESQLNETKEESATAKLQALKAREEILSNFVDLMEMELQCSICNELFIKATSLNCSHVFCKLCINQWMKVKKECPNCRTAITSQMQAQALDSYIDRMVEQLNDDLQQRRKEILVTRKVEQDKFDGVAAGPSTPVSAHPAMPAAPAVVNIPSTSSAASGAGTAGVSSSTVRTSSRIAQRRSRARARGGAASASSTTSRSRPGQASSTALSTTAVTASSSVSSRTGGIPTTPLTTAAGVVADVAAVVVPSVTQSVGTTAASSSSGTASTSGVAGAAVTAVLSAVASATVQGTTPADPANVIELSSDREQEDEGSDNDEEEDEEDNDNEEEEEELTDSDDSHVRYAGHRRRRYLTDSDEDSDDPDSLSPDPDAYYGGYGRCFKCGRRGHWANGCPYE